MMFTLFDDFISMFECYNMNCKQSRMFGMYLCDCGYDIVANGKRNTLFPIFPSTKDIKKINKNDKNINIHLYLKIKRSKSIFECVFVFLCSVFSYDELNDEVYYYEDDCIYYFDKKDLIEVTKRNIGRIIDVLFLRYSYYEYMFPSYFIKRQNDPNNNFKIDTKIKKYFIIENSIYPITLGDVLKIINCGFYYEYIKIIFSMVKYNIYNINSDLPENVRKLYYKILHSFDITPKELDYINGATDELENKIEFSCDLVHFVNPNLLGDF